MLTHAGRTECTIELSRIGVPVLLAWLETLQADRTKIRVRHLVSPGLEEARIVHRQHRLRDGNRIEGGNASDQLVQYDPKVVHICGGIARLSMQHLWREVSQGSD